MYNVSNVNIGKTHGYLACYGMDKNTYWQNADAEITFTPYWITLDGVKVAPQTRTAKYYGPGSDADGNHKKFKVVETVASGIANAFVDDAQQENMLVLMNSYLQTEHPSIPLMNLFRAISSPFTTAKRFTPLQRRTMRFSSTISALKESSLQAGSRMKHAPFPQTFRTLPKALMFMQSTFPIPISGFATIAAASSDSAA